MKRLVKMVLLGVSLFAFAAPAAMMNFDGVSAPNLYNQVTPGGPLGPVVTDGFLTLNGGVILNGAGWSGLQTSSPNLYGTSDFLPLADSSVLPGAIMGTFASPVSDLSFDIINGFHAALFTVTVYNAASAPIGNMVLALAAYAQPGAVGSVSFNGLPGAKWFEVQSAQETGQIDFAIDTIHYANGEVPEPSTFVLMGAGLLAIPLMRRMRNACQAR